MVNQKKFNYSLSEKQHSLDDEMSDNMSVAMNGMHDLHMSPDRVPRGIEVDENRIYFYCAVGTNEALELNRLLRKMDVEMKYLSDRLGCRQVPIHLHINSPGGEAFCGLSIVDTILSCDTPVYTYVDGSAASAATLISMVGKKRFASKNSFMLLHQPSIMLSGKYDEFLDEVKNQEKIFDKIKQIYLDNSKLQAEDLEDLLNHELWLDSDTCIEYGFIDKVY